MRYREWLRKLNLACTSKRRSMHLLWFSRFLAGTAYCPVWISLRISNVVDWSEHSDLSKLSDLFPVPPLIVPSNNFIERQFFMESCVVSVSASKVGKVPYKKGTEILGWSIFRCCSQNPRRLSLGISTGRFGPKLRSHDCGGDNHTREPRARTCISLPTPLDATVARSWLTRTTTDAVWNYLWTCYSWRMADGYW